MKIRKVLLFLAALLSIVPAQSQKVYNQFGTDDINDLALIYIGGRHRPDWNKELFRPYVAHTFADGRKTWMFDGFLMIEFMSQDESGSRKFSFGEYHADGANKEEWEWLLDRQLGISTGLGCTALDQVIGELKTELGTPNHKHKVVLTTIVPVDATKVWGRVNGRALDFSQTADRITAMKWYADLVKEKWASCNFQNIELEGMYWVSEEMKVNGPIAKEVNAYYHSIGLKSYWIPYFSAPNRNNWEEYGFDIAYTQPNYYFRAETPLNQMLEAIGESLTYGLGLEMEFEGYNFSYPGNNKPVVQFTPSNCGLYGYSPEFYQRLVDYIDWFERFGVFANSSIAYYSGYQAVYDYAHSGHPKDQEIMDRLASLMEERHIAAGWHERHLGGVESTETADSEIAVGAKGYIYINDNAGNNVTITNIAGQTIYTSAKSDNAERLQYGVAVHCPAGVYIVATPQHTVKLIVR